MKKSIALFAAVSLFMFPCMGMSQARYADADNPSEAVGMIRVSMHIAEVMLSECTRRFPDLQAQIDADFLKWKTTESRVHEKAGFYWGAMLANDPTLAGTLKEVERTVMASLLQSASQEPESAGRSALHDRCSTHFADLASGIWRMRTPRAYAYMDKGP